MTQYLHHASAYFADALAQLVVPFGRSKALSKEIQCVAFTPQEISYLFSNIRSTWGPSLQETEQLFGLSYYHAEGGWVIKKYCIFTPDISRHRWHRRWCTFHTGVLFRIENENVWPILGNMGNFTHFAWLSFNFKLLTCRVAIYFVFCLWVS